MGADACSDTTVRRITSTDFRAFLSTRPLVALELVDLLLCRIYLICDRSLNLTAEEAQTRLSRLLLQLRYRHGRVVGDEICLDIALTQQEVADMIGTSRQTVSELINKMKAAGEIRVAHHRLYMRAKPDDGSAAEV